MWGILVGVVIAVFAVWFFWDSEEAVLNGHLDAIQQNLSATGGGLGALANAADLRRFADPEGVQVLLDGRRPIVKTPDQLMQMAALWARHSGGGEVSFTKRSHEFPEGGGAVSKIWVVAHSPNTRTELEQGAWFSITWRKNADGDWVVRSVRPLEP